ncbi:thiol-disulfide oxidoreductase [Anaerococcus octavius]|mgnify:FL=1|uniref:Thiol-disulfide oxidoreductase n=1 Tax=Anaerococcus octavius TaxID=54007 RepID=A0A380WZ15_9FIRM|nr:TlpA disulfide reductase family protein [Anaerococcus octavius]SUU93354.1 thiol-disulfide oxidoreductase [Anaerococcus octavius]
MRKVNNIYTIIMLGLLLAACQNNDKQANDEKMKNETKAEIPAEKEDQKTDNKEMTVEEKDSSKMADKNTLPNFTAKDQDGNPFTNEDIAKNDATVINLWFTGCSACVEEMDELNNIADELKKDDGVDFVSMCTDVNYDDSTKEAYQRIIKEKKPTYKALAVDYEGDMKDYLENIFVYPTTIVVDKNGNVIGDPVEGSLVSEDQQAKLKENIKKAIESSQASK